MLQKVKNLRVNLVTLRCLVFCFEQSILAFAKTKIRNLLKMY
jgi:hypothetical protein